MNPVDLARLDLITREIHAEARAATARRSYAEGATGRRIVNRLRTEIGLDRLSYHGVPMIRARHHEEAES